MVQLFGKRWLAVVALCILCSAPALARDGGAEANVRLAPPPAIKAGRVAPRPAAGGGGEGEPEPEPPEFPKTDAGTLDKAALYRELMRRDQSPEAMQRWARSAREASNEPGYRISPIFGSEETFFRSIRGTQSNWALLLGAFVRYRWFLAGAVLALIGYIAYSNWRRWRRLERDFLLRSGPSQD